MDDHRSPDTGHANGTKGPAALESITPIGTGSSGASPDPAASHEADPTVRHGQAPMFLAELAHAMQAAADRERERIAAVVAEEASGHVEKVRSRAAIETEELRRLAEEDVARIDEWSASEIERIRAEAVRKADERRASLEDYLHQHDAIIAAEIEGVDGAVREYGVTLDTFFAGLSDSNDPSEIVRRAETLPPPPDLDAVRGTARVEAVARFTGGTAPTQAADDTTPEAPAGSAGEPTAAIEPTEPTGSIEADASTGTTTTATTTPAADDEVAATEATAGTEAATSVEDAAGATPVGVMDPTSGTVPGWPADDHIAVAQTTDHASAAVRLLRTVAPWTAPVHAEDPETKPDPD